jgi:hypothetical protein
MIMNHTKCSNKDSIFDVCICTCEAYQDDVDSTHEPS